MAISIADSSSSSPRSSLGFLLDPVKVEPPRPKQSMWHRLGLRRWLGRDDRDFSSRSTASSDTSPASNDRSQDTNSPPPKSHDNLTRRLSRRVGVGLPRSTTFKRQNSERRDRLSPVSSEHRRATSADRRTLSLQRTKSPQSVVDPRLSAPEINWPREDPNSDSEPDPDPSPTKVNFFPGPNEDFPHDSDARSEWDQYPELTDTPEGYPVANFDMELERRWILNLSMHFRDRSEREKFFVTYAETANRWRRVTISCDYRDAEPESLEQDLKELRYQRDKCARIYESIRDSLPEIQFYDTVTNLKLETRDGRLHVHVTEDVNEIIPYPPVSSIGHLPEAQLIPERRLNFEAHLSGFVYNVRLGDRSFIKKEIPGPDTVDEFLYEINALHALYGTPNVIQVEGIVVDDREEVVKGLLISFAEKGALVDILYEYRGTISWERRERWAKQIVHGLCEIHEAGYVQGDFTLSNIVVDGNDDAKIIDINRRGCPVGWEPPEIAAKIESNQRISMYIGVKTDLYQLGMTLWALAMEEDEPERQCRPFVLDENVPIPDYYRRLVSICLSPVPRQRLSAKELLSLFPSESGTFDYLPRRQPHTNIGVGLFTNGALPLYDSRAAFMYPHGRQMGGFGGHDNTQTPPQPPLDSFESMPSPETDVQYFDNREMDRQIELHDAGAQPHEAWRRNSMGFGERGSVDDSTPANPTHLEDTQDLQQSPLMEYAESHISLDAGVDPGYGKSSTDTTTADPVLVAKLLPDELADIGSRKPPSSNNPSIYQYSEPATTHDPAHMYSVESRSSMAHIMCGQGPLDSAPPLLQPAIQTKPGAETEPEINTLTDNQTTTSAVFEPTQRNTDQQSTYLSHSGLPINPAVKFPEDILSQDVASQPPSKVEPPPECPRNSTQDTPLSDSLLPINPAARVLDVKPSNPDTETQSLRNAMPQDPLLSRLHHDFALSESRLPINPATGSPKETNFQTNALSPPDGQIPQQLTRIEGQGILLGTSQLPTNPATIYAEEALSYPTEVEPAVDVQPVSRLPKLDPGSDGRSLLSNPALPFNPATASADLPNLSGDINSTSSGYSTLCRESVHPSHDENPFLTSSLLPINPAVISSDTNSREIDPTLALKARSTSCVEQIAKDHNQNSFLSNSHLPVNPTSISLAEQISKREFEPVSMTEAHSTSYAQHNIHNPPCHLHESHLPINPAFIDKVLQPV